MIISFFSSFFILFLSFLSLPSCILLPIIKSANNQIKEGGVPHG
nr:MAG TPA: hypothetical protein [Caudoviricetes sp.]